MLRSMADIAREEGEDISQWKCNWPASKSSHSGAVPQRTTARGRILWPHVVPSLALFPKPRDSLRQMGRPKRAPRLSCELIAKVASRSSVAVSERFAAEF